MTLYSLTYKDPNGDDHSITLEADSGTHAIAVAMEQYKELRLHPNRITRVHEEASK